MNEKTKKKFTQTRLFIFLVAYIGLALLLLIIALIFGNANLNTVGDYFMKGSGAVVLLFLLIRRGNTQSIQSYRHNMHNQNFKKVRAQDKPIERVMFMIILAAATLALTGLLLTTLITL